MSNHYEPEDHAPGAEVENRAEKLAALFGGVKQRGTASISFAKPSTSKNGSRVTSPTKSPASAEPARASSAAASETQVASTTNAETNAKTKQEEVESAQAEAIRRSSNDLHTLNAIEQFTRGRASSVKNLFEAPQAEHKPSIRRRSFVRIEDSPPKKQAASESTHNSANILKKELEAEKKRETEKLEKAAAAAAKLNLNSSGGKSDEPASRLASRSKTFSGPQRSSEPTSEQAGFEAPDTESKMQNRRSTGTGMGIKCVVCLKPAYAMEKVEADGLRYHTWCFRCAHCNKQVKAGNYASLEGKIYCKPCFMKLFKVNGNYANGFGKEAHKMKWIRGEVGNINQ